METERKKFWRVLFVVEDGSTEESMKRWLNVIRSHTESVIMVSLGDMTAADLIELPADCMVVDGRANDLAGVGMLMTQAGNRLLPSLTLYDERWHERDIMLCRQMIAGTTLYPYAEDDFEHILEDFLHRTPAHDHRKEYEESPWIPRPRSVTIEQIRLAMARTGRGPYGMV